MPPKKSGAHKASIADGMPFVRPRVFVEISQKVTEMANPDPDVDGTAQDEPPIAVNGVSGETVTRDVVVARLVFELAAEVCPRTCENFKQICTGATIGDKKGKETRSLSYTGSRLLRITPNGIQCGDATGKPGGKGVDSIYGTAGFEDEALGSVPHQRGVLSMCNSGPNTNGCQFFICLLNDATHLDGRHTSFGRLVEGEDSLRQLQDQLTAYYEGDVVEAAGDAAENLHGFLPEDCPFTISSAGVVPNAAAETDASAAASRRASRVGGPAAPRRRMS